VMVAHRETGVTRGMHHMQCMVSKETEHDVIGGRHCTAEPLSRPQCGAAHCVLPPVSPRWLQLSAQICSCTARSDLHQVKQPIFCHQIMIESRRLVAPQSLYHTAADAAGPPFSRPVLSSLLLCGMKAPPPQQCTYSVLMPCCKTGATCRT
jgi:hypothetical protein